MVMHLALPFHPAPLSDTGSLITQQFGITTVEAEPPGFVFRDASVDYFTPGPDSQRHEHVHAGIDYALGFGTPLVAPASGIVTFAGIDTTGFGQCVKISHGPVTTLYGHLSRIEVSVTQRVRRGDEIGQVGSTGNSSGPHLHWSLIRPADDHYVNPALSVIVPATFAVTADADGRPVRVFTDPSRPVTVMRTVPPGALLPCTGWTYGQLRRDDSTGQQDARWYRLAAGGWVASARVQGNAPHSLPLP